jgi:nitroreductase
MSFLELAKKRYSVRDFKPNAVEREKLQTILEAGRVAPTGGNRQPQRLVVIQQREELTKVSKAANIFEAPLVILVCAERETAWVRPFDGKNISDIDASVVTDHMMLQATELGLGSVWICYFNSDTLKREMNLPDAWEPVNILAIGYANDKAASPDRHQTTRKPLKETVFFETPQSVK